MESVIIQASQLILSLSIMVVLHELGHFIPAKLFKTKVEKFYLFFDYKFSLFKKKIGETEYGVGWIPLGGYVKIAGMIDESMDKEQMKEEPKPWEFRTKPAWQRLIIMLGGVTVNFILGVVIFIGAVFYWGDSGRISNANLVNGIHVIDTLGTNMGLRNGDRIIKVDDESVSDFGKITGTIIMDEAEKLTVDRDGEYIDLDIPYYFNKVMIARGIKGFGFIAPRVEFIIDSVLPDNNAYRAGFNSGDRFIALNGEPKIFFDEYKEYFDAHKGEDVTIKVIRDGVEYDKPVTISEDGLIGVSRKFVDLLPLENREYGFFESFPVGIEKGYTTLIMMIKQLGLMFSPKTEGYKHVGGFVSIGKIFSPTWNWQVFWSMTALLSIMLGVMNLLPIPALDGGHVIFLIYEMIMGKALNDKIMEYAQVVGFVILIGLLVFANGNDIYKLFQ
jgi:regulator of sigma E protease